MRIETSRPTSHPAIPSRHRTSSYCTAKTVTRVVYFILLCAFEPGSKLLVLGMVIPPLIGNPYNGYINPYYWVDDHPLLYGNNGSLDPGTFGIMNLGL